jgi:hypothetical protein
VPVQSALMLAVMCSDVLLPIAGPTTWTLDWLWALRTERMACMDRCTSCGQLREVECATAPVGDHQKAVSAQSTKSMVREADTNLHPLGALTQLPMSGS